MTVLEYIIEEVTRQGHHTHVFNDGGVRVGWMLAGWEHAFLNRHTVPTITDPIFSPANLWGKGIRNP